MCMSNTGVLMANMMVSSVIPAVFNVVFSFCKTTLALFSMRRICAFTAVLSNTNILVSISSIGALAIDRLVSVSTPLRYSEMATPHRALIFVGFQVSYRLVKLLIN